MHPQESSEAPPKEEALASGREQLGSPAGPGVEGAGWAMYSGGRAVHRHPRDLLQGPLHLPGQDFSATRAC